MFFFTRIFFFTHTLATAIRSRAFFNPHLIFLLECNGWVVLDFPQVHELYSVERSKYKGPDPFFRKGPRELKRYCDELRRSGVYGMWSVDGPHPPMVIAPQTPAPNKKSPELAYRYQKVADIRYPIPMFACLNHANDGYLYLSYGFKDDFLFIFGNSDDKSRGSVLEIKGIMEKSPRVEKNFQENNVLEMVFWNALIGNKTPLPSLEGKSALHFRLCSLVLDSLRNFLSPQKVYTINFGLEYDDGRAVVTRPLMYQFLRGRIESYLSAIPCSMNRSFKRPIFFIVPDPTHPENVFVLMEKEDLLDTKTKYIAKYYVRDVTVLKNWSNL